LPPSIEPPADFSLVKQIKTLVVLPGR